jgi:hypothetical protein
VHLYLIGKPHACRVLHGQPNPNAWQEPMAKRQPKPLPKLDTLGPTPETMRHGDYVLPETRGALAVYTNRRANYIGRLHTNGCITKRQLAAGLLFIETHNKAWGTVSRRDSTQPWIAGQMHETAEQADRMAKLKARLNTIANRIGPARYSLLRSCVVYGETIGPNRGAARDIHRMLCESLDQCAIVYGVEE